MLQDIIITIIGTVGTIGLVYYLISEHLERKEIYKIAKYAVSQLTDAQIINNELDSLKKYAPSQLDFSVKYYIYVYKIVQKRESSLLRK